MGAKMYLHGVVWQDKAGENEAVIYTEKDIETGKTELKVEENPEYTIGITREGLREGINVKPLKTPISDLDEYQVTRATMMTTIKKALYGSWTQKYIHPNQLVNSPFVHGADLEADAVVKQRIYNHNNGQQAESYRTAGLDIETDVLNKKMFASEVRGQKIIIINYCSPEHKVYSTVLRGFLGVVTEEEVRVEIEKSIEKYKKGVNKRTRKLLEAQPIEYVLNIVDSELDMILWIMNVIHEDKPDFCSIWNMPYDASFILDRLVAYGKIRRTYKDKRRNRSIYYDPDAILCHPDVPAKYRYITFEDQKPRSGQHFTHTWPLFNIPGYTHCFCGQRLFSRNRRVTGIEDSYALEVCATKELGNGKEEMSEGGHTEMQSTRKAEYCGYGVVDSVILPLFDKVTASTVSLCELMTHAGYDCFAQQTVQLKYRMFDYFKQKGAMLASQRGKILQATDKFIENVGGNVLEPGLAWRCGMVKFKCLRKWIGALVSKLCQMVSDIDVTFSKYAVACCSGNTAPISG